MGRRGFGAGAIARTPFVWIAGALLGACGASDSALATGDSWHTDENCWSEFPALQISLPVPEGTSNPDGGTLKGVRYTAKPEGAVQVFLSYEYEEGYIGVLTEEAGRDSEEARDSAGDPANGGRRITYVQPASPAEKSGLKTGDVILEVDGGPLLGGEQLSAAIRDHDRKLPLRLAVVRRGARLEVSVEIAVRRVQQEDFVRLDARAFGEPIHTGLVLGHIGAEFAAYLPAASRTGVLVLDVAAGSPAAEARLKPGDIITSFDAIAVQAADIAIARIESAAADGRTLALEGMRGTKEIQATLEPAEDLRRDKEYSVPFVFGYESRRERTDFWLGPLGLVGNYKNTDCFDSKGEAVEEWKFGMLVDLIRYERKSNQRELRLLWLISFKY